MPIKVEVDIDVEGNDWLCGCLGCLGTAGDNGTGVTVGPGEAVAGSR